MAQQSITITATGLGDLIGREWSFADALDYDLAELTTEHPSSSRGLPVLVADGRAYGPSELPGVVLVLSSTNPAEADLIGPARAAGYTVRVLAWCDWCAESLAAPEFRHPGSMHARCAEARVVVNSTRRTGARNA